MNPLAEKTLSFFINNFPPWKIILITSGSLILIPLLGIVSTGVEAVSPHGCGQYDNAGHTFIPGICDILFTAIAGVFLNQAGMIYSQNFHCPVRVNAPG